MSLSFVVWSFVLNSTVSFTEYVSALVQRRYTRSKFQSSSSLQAVKESTFGMGCFWEPSEELLKVNGVIDTVAGYTGNPSTNEVPSYGSVCKSNDWVEGVRVTFDDDIISYQQLLDEFFTKQKPKLGIRQYASVIFPHDEEQMTAATTWIEENKGRKREDGFRAEWTAVEPKSKFYQAERYHQRYWQKQRLRFGLILILLAVGRGIFNPIIPVAFQNTAEGFANAYSIYICTYIITERLFASKVVEL